MAAVVANPAEEMHPANRLLARGLYDPQLNSTDLQIDGFIGEIFPRERSLGQAVLYATLARELFISKPSKIIDLVEGAEVVTRDIGVDAGRLTANSLVDVSEITERQIDVAMAATEGVEEDKRGLAISLFFAMRAHFNQERLSGADYADHPISAAAMGLHAFEILEREGYEIPVYVRNAILELAVWHDFTENTMRGSKHFTEEREGHYTPLLLERTEDRIGNPLHREMADTLMYMTHLRRREWMLSKSEYYRFGSYDLFFDLVKILDVKHNSDIEPKPTDTEEEVADWKETLSIYGGSKRLMKKHSGQIAAYRDDGLDWSWTDRWFEIIEGIEKDDVPDMVEHFNEYVGFDYKDASLSHFDFNHRMPDDLIT